MDYLNIDVLVVLKRVSQINYFKRRNDVGGDDFRNEKKFGIVRQIFVRKFFSDLAQNQPNQNLSIHIVLHIFSQRKNFDLSFL